MEHIVIITGGYLNIEFARTYIKTLSYDRVFAVDKGLEYAKLLGLQPDYIVGDFDTVEEEVLREFEAEIEAGTVHAYVERHAAKKDATDTELAVLKAIEDRAGCITVLAATGSRFDHVLANIGLLIQTARSEIPCFIVDETNRIRLLEGESVCVLKRNEQYGTYLSLFPLSETVEGVTIEGVMYPLYNRRIYQENSLTVSNQIAGEEARLAIRKGRILVIESKDVWNAKREDR